MILVQGCLKIDWLHHCYITTTAIVRQDKIEWKNGLGRVRKTFRLKLIRNLKISLSGSVTRLAIYWTLGNFSKATTSLLKSTTFFGNFCKSVKILMFSSEMIFGQLLKTFGDILLVTLLMAKSFPIKNYFWKMHSTGSLIFLFSSFKDYI